MLIHGVRNNAGPGACDHGEHGARMMLGMMLDIMLRAYVGWWWGRGGLCCIIPIAKLTG